MVPTVSNKTRGRYNARIWCALIVALLATLAYATYATYASSGHWVAVSVESGSLSPVISTSGRYAASNLLNSTVAAVVNSGSSFYNVTSTANSMTIGGDIDGNNVYLVLTKGTVETIAEMIPSVLSGAFETYINPSFAYTILKKNHITVGLDYSDKSINLTGDYKLSPGTYALVVKNEGVQNGKTVVSIKRKA